MRTFAIVLVCYNRLNGLKRLVRALEKVDYDGRKDITLIFSIDNSGKDDVENFAKMYKWMHGDKLVRTFPKRQGLKNHVLQCGDYTSEYDIVAVFEDDIYVSDSFYHYAYQAADFYWNEDKVAGISLYSYQKNWLNWLLRFEPQKAAEYDSYFLRVAMSWGQVWTGPKWREFKEWYRNNQVFTKSDLLPAYLNTWPESSWLKYHDRYCIETDRYFVYPYVSVSTNYSDAGEHATISLSDHQVELQYGKKQYSFPKYNEDAVRYDEYCDRVGLGEHLGLPENELCVDFWATKGIKLRKRYILTTDQLNYRLMKQFALALRPIELNVMLDMEGCGIYLYDTSMRENSAKKKNSSFERIIYSIRSHDEIQLFLFSLRLLVLNLNKKMRVKAKKLFKNK